MYSFYQSVIVLNDIKWILWLLYASDVMHFIFHLFSLEKVKCAP